MAFLLLLTMSSKSCSVCIFLCLAVKHTRKQLDVKPRFSMIIASPTSFLQTRYLCSLSPGDALRLMSAMPLSLRSHFSVVTICLHL